MNKKQPTFRQRLGAAIAGATRKSFIPALNPFDDEYSGGWGSGRTNDFKSKPDQITANVGWSFAANKAIAEACAAVELELYKIKSDGDREQIFDHPILDLLNGPNAAHTGEQLRQLHFTYLNFTGESYILMTDAAGPMKPSKGKLPMAMQILESQRVAFKMEPLFSQSIVKVGEDEFPITSVIRDINPNPMSPYSGMSVVQAAAQTIDLDRAMKEWNASLVANGAKPSLIFTSQEPMDDESYERWKKQFADDNTGGQNAGKPLLIEGGDAKPWMMTPSDLDFLASRKFSMDEILAMWRVPAAVLGMSKDFNRANMDAAFYIHTVVNVVPRVRQFVQQLNQTLVKPFDSSLELSLKNPVPEDQEAKLAQAVQGVNKFRTIDETRALYGLDALPDGLGNQMYVPGLTVSLDSVADAGNADDQASQDANDKQLTPGGVKKNS